MLLCVPRSARCICGRRDPARGRAAEHLFPGPGSARGSRASHAPAPLLPTAQALRSLRAAAPRGTDRCWEGGPGGGTAASVPCVCTCVRSCGQNAGPSAVPVLQLKALTSSQRQSKKGSAVTTRCSARRGLVPRTGRRRDGGTASARDWGFPTALPQQKDSAPPTLTGLPTLPRPPSQAALGRKWGRG